MNSEISVLLKEGVSLAEVTRRENGIEIGKRKVLIDDLLRSFLKFMEPAELIGFLIEEGYSEAITTLLEHTVDVDVLQELFEMLLNRANEEAKLEEDLLFASLLSAMLKRVDVTNIETGILPNLLEAALKNIESVNCEEVNHYNLLFKRLLEKVNIHEASQEVIGEFLTILMERVVNETNEHELERIFTAIAEKSKERWIEKVISLRRPNTTVARTPILPRGTIHFSEDLSGVIQIAIEVPKERFNVILKNREYSNVGHPRLIFVFRTKGEKILNMWILTVDNKPLTPHSTIYHYPFAHVYQNCTVCWGYRNEMVTSLDYLAQLPFIFIQTPNNHDLANNALASLFSKLQDSDFDDKWLKPTEYKLSDFIKL